VRTTRKVLSQSVNGAPVSSQVHRTQDGYHADDSDLPDFILGKSPAPAPKIPDRPIPPPTTRELVREAAARETIIHKENREALAEGRRIYIKSKKRDQMFRWLLELHDSPALNPWERGFCFSLLVKFRKYKRVKWITEKQYQCLARIAQKRQAYAHDRHAN
jgi:hypothetical protein